MPDEIARRVRTQAERDADGTTWRNRPGDNPSPECQASLPTVHDSCDNDMGCTCSCHSPDLEQIKARFLAGQDRRPVLLDFGPAYGDKAGPGTSVEIVRTTPPRRRWWHRYTRRA